MTEEWTADCTLSRINLVQAKKTHGAPLGGYSLLVVVCGMWLDRLSTRYPIRFEVVPSSSYCLKPKTCFSQYKKVAMFQRLKMSYSPEFAPLWRKSVEVHRWGVNVLPIPPPSAPLPLKRFIRNNWSPVFSPLVFLVIPVRRSLFVPRRTILTAIF